jgi:hypothetical protein
MYYLHVARAVRLDFSDVVIEADRVYLAIRTRCRQSRDIVRVAFTLQTLGFLRGRGVGINPPISCSCEESIGGQRRNCSYRLLRSLFKRGK